MRTIVQLLTAVFLLALITTSVPAQSTPPAGNLIVSRTIYSGTASTVTIGQPLPGGGTAVANGSYPFVWANEGPDGSFGVTSPIFLDQISDSGAVTTMPVPTNQVVTSFSSKSEIAINPSADGNVMTFMGYTSQINTLDVSNSNTPGHVDPTNPVTFSTPRAVAQLNQDGSIQVTPVNSYSGNNGRAAIAANGVYYMAGNAGNGGSPEPLNVINNTGVQMATPGGSPESSVVGVEKGNCHPPVANGCQYGFAVADLGLPDDKSGKDDNFRGLTIFNNTLYVTKGSGGNGINTLYQVGSAGALPTAATAASTPITIVPGFYTGLAKNTTAPLPRFPFGIFFANANTVYIADEGDGTLANAGKDPQSGLQKWILVNGTWQLAYTLQNGLNLGVQYSVPNGPNGEIYPTSLNPATDGLRNLHGRVNGDGTVTLYAITSTVSASKDQGADPNKLVSITDTLSFTTATQAAGEQFTTLRTAAYGEALRGVAWTPKSFVPATLPPTITGIAPASGVQGTTVPVTMTGTNLSGVSSVTFSGTGVTASIQTGTTSLPSSFQTSLAVTIAPTATPGSRTMTVTTATGSVTSTFTVQAIAVTQPLPITDVEGGTLKSGYAIITPDPGTTAPIPTVTYGIVSGGAVQSQAGVSTVPLTTSASLFVELIPSISRNLGIAILNPSATANTVTLTLYDTSGAPAATAISLTIQAQQQVAKFVSDLFPTSTSSNGFRGSLLLQSSTAFAVMGLRFSGQEFSTLPATGLTPVAGIPTRTLTAGATANVPLAGTVGGTSAIAVPQFAMAGGWATEIALVNATTTLMTGRVDIFDTSANPLGVKLNGTTQSTFSYSIPPTGTFLLAPRDANGQSPF